MGNFEKSKMIEFSIYNLNSKNTLTLEVLIMGSLIVSLYLLFPKINIGLLLIPLIVFIFFKVSRNDKNEIIGKIYLTNHHIKVKTKSNEFQVDIHNLDRFEMTYSGYHGQRLRGDIIGPFNTFSGIDNYISLVKDNSEFRCRFLVENSKEECELIELIKKWETLGYDIDDIRINK